MTVRRRALGGAGALAASQVFTQGLSFLRNVLFARALTEHDFGVAVALAAVLSLLEMTSSLAVDRLLVQAKDGGEDRVQRVAQSFEAMRGALISALLFGFAAPFAAYFKAPEATWAFQLVALAPLVRGFAHMDLYRAQRELRFMPQVVVEVAPAALATALAWPVARWMGDYGAVAWLVVGQAAATAALSHVIAGRRYGLAWDRALAARIVRFGWPLLINGLLMYVIFQGDFLVIGRWYGLEALAVYSVAFNLALAPSIALGRAASSLLLPLLAQAQDDGARFLRRYELSNQALALAAAALAVPLAVFGGSLVRVIFGAKYDETGAFIGWIAAMQALRVLRMAPTVAAMARGDTINAMWANVARTAALIGVIGAAAAQAPLVWIAAAGFAGEAAALACALLLLRRKHGTPVAACLGPGVIVGIATAGAFAAGSAPAVHDSLVMGAAVSAALLLAAGGGMLAVFAPIRHETWQALAGARRRATGTPA